MADFYITTVDFLKAELDLGRTFASIAESTSDDDKFTRNRDNTKETIRTIEHFLGTIRFSQTDFAYLRDGIQELKHRWQKMRCPANEIQVRRSRIG